MNWNKKKTSYRALSALAIALNAELIANQIRVMASLTLSVLKKTLQNSPSGQCRIKV